MARSPQCYNGLCNKQHSYNRQAAVVLIHVTSCVTQSCLQFIDTTVCHRQLLWNLWFISMTQHYKQLLAEPRLISDSSVSIWSKDSVFSKGIMEKNLGGWPSSKLPHHWRPNSSRPGFWFSQTWVVSSQPFPLWHSVLCSQSLPVGLHWQLRCICGDTQSMSHIINDCPVNKFEGGLPALHTASDSARERLHQVHCIC